MTRRRFRKKMHIFRNRRPDNVRYSTVHPSRMRFNCQCFEIGLPCSEGVSGDLAKMAQGSMAS
jgi:hypothetical protein